MKKQDKLDLLVEKGIISEEQSANFEKLTSDDLDIITGLVVSRETIQEELGKAEAEKEELQELLNKKAKDYDTLNESYQATLDKIHVEKVVEEKKPVPGLKFTFRGRAYKFTDDAPKSILFNGNVVTQKQLAEDEESLLQLIGNRSGLIQEI